VNQSSNQNVNLNRGSEEPGPDGTEHVPIHPAHGFAKRANRGLREAGRTARRALLLNDDTTIERGTLAALAQALETHPLAGAVLLDWDGERVQQAGISVAASGRVKAISTIPTEAVAQVDAVSGAAMGIDLDRFRELSEFEERFTFYMEDIDLCRRAGGAVVVRDARVRHRGGGTRSRSSPEAAYHLGRSHTLLARRLGGGRLQQGRRILYVSALGWAWTARHGGPAALPRFAYGALAGLLA
jgi:GT2 family glycosyltransferase